MFGYLKKIKKKKKKKKKEIDRRARFKITLSKVQTWQVEKIMWVHFVALTQKYNRVWLGWSGGPSNSQLFEEDFEKCHFFGIYIYIFITILIYISNYTL